MPAWNPRGIATFDHVCVVEDGAERVLGYEEFRNLPLDVRVRMLLGGKPRFFQRGKEISKAVALGRRPA